MKKYVMMFFLMFFASTALANSCFDIRVGGLSEKQISELRIQCEQSKMVGDQSPYLEGVTSDKVSEWSDVAGSFAAALGTAAKELGVTVNEFLKTPAGYFTIAVIAWKVAGTALVSFLLCVIYAFISFKFIDRLWFKGIEYVDKNFCGIEWKGKVKRYLSYDDMTEGGVLISMLIFFSNLVLVIISVSSI